MPNDILEAIVNQADEHQKDTSANLEALIQQNDENNPNPNLEVLINQNDDNNNKVVEKLDELKPSKENVEDTKKLMGFMSDFFESMKGSKGDKGESIKGKDGYSPVVGKDYFTNKDKDSFIAKIIKELKIYIKGLIPVKGKDYFDGKDGKNGIDGNNAKEVDINDLVKKTLERISKPKDGKNAKELNINDIVNKVVSKIKSLKDDNRVSYNNLKDVPQIYRKDTALGGMSNTTVLINLDGDPENLSSQCDGSNTVFNIEAPILSVIFLSLNGQVLLEGLDFTKTTKQITLLRDTPESGEELYIKYVKI